MSEHETTTSAEPQSKKILLVDPKDLTIVKKEGEELYDDRGKWKFDEAMVKNIMMLGVLQPIMVRKNGEELDVIDGRQRTINTLEANKRLAKLGQVTHRIPCIVRNDETKLLEGIMVSANEHRRGDQYVTKARKVQQLLNHGQTEEEVANYFGCTVASIKNYLQILECSKKVQGLVQSGRLSADLAKKLHKLPKGEQDEAVDKLIAEGATKGKKAKKALAKHTKSDDDTSLSKKEIRDLFESLKTTAKETKGDEEVGLLESIKLLEFVTGKRKSCPFNLVEAAEVAPEPPKKRGRKPKEVTAVSASPKKRGRKAKGVLMGSDEGAAA